MFSFTAGVSNVTPACFLIVQTDHQVGNVLVLALLAKDLISLVFSLEGLALSVEVLRGIDNFRPLAFARNSHLRAVSWRGWLQRFLTAGGS